MTSLVGCSFVEGLVDRFQGEEKEDAKEKDGVEDLDEEGGRVRLRGVVKVDFDDDALNDKVTVTLDEAKEREFEDYTEDYILAGSLAEIEIDDIDSLGDEFEVTLYIDEAYEGQEVVVVYINPDEEEMTILEGEIDEDEISVMVDTVGYYGVFISESKDIWSENEETSDVTEETSDKLSEETADKTTDETTDETSTDSEEDVADETADDTTDETTEDANGDDTETSTGIGYSNDELGGRLIGAYPDSVFEYLPDSHTITTVFETNPGYTMMLGAINRQYPVICVAEDALTLNGFYLYNIDSQEERFVTVGDTPSKYLIQWSPNGENLAISDGNALYIYKYGEDTNYKITDAKVTSLAWTSNSGGLLYTSVGNGISSLNLKVMGGGATEFLTSFSSSTEQFALVQTQGNITDDVFFALASLNDSGSYKGVIYDHGSKLVSEVGSKEALNEAYYLAIDVMPHLTALVSNGINTEFPRLIDSDNELAKWIHADGYLGAFINNDISQSIWIGFCNDCEMVKW